MNEKMMLVTILLTVLFTATASAETPEMPTQEETPDANSFFESKDLTTTYTLTTKTVCNPYNLCSLTIYSGTRHVLEDGIWKPVEEANSLKDYYFVNYLEDDNVHRIKVIDFNLNYIELEMTYNYEYLGEFEEEVKDGKMETEFKVIETVCNELTSQCNEEETKYGIEINEKESITQKLYMNPLGKKFKIGESSTAIYITGADSEILDDDSTNTIGSDAYMYPKDEDCPIEYAYIKFNIDVIPDVDEIVDADLMLDVMVEVSESDDTLYIYSVENETWEEEDGADYNATNMDFIETGVLLETITNIGNAWLPPIDVTSDIQTAYSLGDVNVTYGLFFEEGTPDSGCDYLKIGTKENDVSATPYLTVYYITTDDINVVIDKVDGYNIYDTLPSFTYIDDGNLTIDFNVNTTYDFEHIKVDLNYSTTATQGSGEVIVDGLVVDSNNCQTNFINSWDNTASSDANLVGYWKFDVEEDVNTQQAFDYSGNENHGLYQGTYKADNNGVGKWDNNAAWFGGSSQINGIDIGESSELDLIHFSILTWIKIEKPVGSSAYGTIIAKRGTSSDYANYFMRIQQGGKITVGFHDGARWKECTTKPMIISTDVWYHLAGTYNQENIKVYFNGSLIKTCEFTETPQTNDRILTIGRIYGGSGEYYNGLIEELKLYNGAVAESQIIQDYNLGARNHRVYTWDWNIYGVADEDYYINKYAYGDTNTSFSPSIKTIQIGEGGAVDLDANAIYIDTFEIADMNWVNEATEDDCEWQRDNLGTPSSSTGPCFGSAACAYPAGALGTDYYMYIEASSGGYPNCSTTGDEAWLISPEINFDTYTAIDMNFYYNMYGSTMGTLSLDENTSGSWTEIWSLTGNQGTPWVNKYQELSDVTGKGSLRLRAVRGSSYYSDVTVDEIRIHATEAGSTCTCPTSGHWEINYAQNCTLADECYLTSGNLHIVNGSLNITSSGILVLPSGQTISIETGSNFYIEEGGQLIINT